MALKIRSLAPVAVVLLAAAYALLRPARSAEPSQSERQAERLWLLSQREGEAGARMVALAERDSGILAASKAAPGRPSIQFRGFPAGSAAPVANEVVNRLWRQLGPSDSAVRVTLLIYNSAEYRRQRLWTYAGAYVTLAPGGPVCAAITPGGLEADGSIKVGKEWTERVLAPCLLVAGFGPPGPSIGRWLGNTRYAAAGSVAWLNRSRSFVDGEGSPPWMAGFRREGSEPTGFQSSGSLLHEVAQLLNPPYELGAYGLRCTNGDAASCRSGVLDSTVMIQATRGIPADLTYSWSILDRPTSWTLSTPLPPGESWLSDLIRDQGREKFARFWKSPAPFEKAFQEAFGEDLGAWTHRWSVRQWENSWFEKYRRSPMILGATLEPTWPLLVLGWTGVALLLTASVARRRQVT